MDAPCFAEVACFADADGLGVGFPVGDGVGVALPVAAPGVADAVAGAGWAGWWLVVWDRSVACRADPPPSAPFTVQVTSASAPMPAASAMTRRRQ